MFRSVFFFCLYFLGLTIAVSAQSELRLQPIISDLPASWAIAIAPNDQLFITHRKGALLRSELNGANTTIYDLALEDLYYKGQGGLLAIAFHPDYKNTPWIYLSYSFGTVDANGLKVIRVMIIDDEIAKKETVFTQQHLRDTAAHYGGRIAFNRHAELLVATGDGFDYREQAQVDSSDIGKILKVDLTGLVSIESKGHRNPQGLIMMPNGVIIGHEHGPAGGDEINIIEQGKNYGWPVITNGKDYIGGLISPFNEYQGMEQPAFDWTPSIAPAGMIFYGSSRIPALSQHLLVTSLKFRQLHALSVSFNQMNLDNRDTGHMIIGDDAVHFGSSEYRMRDITQSSEGRVFILSDGSNAKVLEVVPLSSH